MGNGFYEWLYEWSMNGGLISYISEVFCDFHCCIKNPNFDIFPPPQKKLNKQLLYIADKWKYR